MATKGANAGTLWQIAGKKQYELSNHLGNVLATVSDKTNDVNADVLTMNDYYAFGKLQTERSYTQIPNQLYKYGFNGKENDNDVGRVAGEYQYYGMRLYDARIGRFLSVDPIFSQYPELTQYQFASNNAIESVDMDGLEASTSKKQVVYGGIGGTAIKQTTNQAVKRQISNSLINESGELTLEKSVERGGSSVMPFLGKALGLTVGLVFMDAGLGKDDVMKPPLERFTTDYSKLSSQEVRQILDRLNKGIVTAQDLLSQVEVRGRINRGNSANDVLNYSLVSNDIDLRGTNTPFLIALAYAFSKTGIDRDDFAVTKWGVDIHGKSLPVMFKAPRGAEVSIDFAHKKAGPDAPHIGWQTGVKKKTVGHIILDDVPAGRTDKKP